MTDFDDVPLFTGCPAPLSVDPPRAGHALSAAQARAAAEQRSTLLNAAALARDEHLARQRLLQMCAHPAFAAAALPLDGRPPPLPLVRCAARCWGNLEFGIREEAGSDGEAFAWDLETNVRAVRRFSGKLEDENRKNGPLIEALLDILPVTLIDEALDACRRTCEAGPSAYGRPEVRCGLTPVSDRILHPEHDLPNVDPGLERSDSAAATLSASGHDDPAGAPGNEAARPENTHGCRAGATSRRGRRAARRMDDTEVSKPAGKTLSPEHTKNVGPAEDSTSEETATLPLCPDDTRFPCPAEGGGMTPSPLTDDTTPDPAEACGSEGCAGIDAKSADELPRASVCPEKSRKSSRRTRGIASEKKQAAPEKGTAGRRRKALRAKEEKEEAGGTGSLENGLDPMAPPAAETTINAGPEEDAGVNADLQGAETPSEEKEEKEASPTKKSGSIAGAEPDAERSGGSGGMETERVNESENNVPPAKAGTSLLRYRPELIHCPETSRDVDTLECHVCGHHDICPAYA